MASECSAQRESLPPFTRVYDAVIRSCSFAPRTILTFWHCVFVSVAVHQSFSRLIYASLPSPWDLFNSTRLRSTIAPVCDTKTVDQQLLCTTFVVAAWLDLCQASCLIECRGSSPDETSALFVSSQFLPCYHDFVHRFAQSSYPACLLQAEFATSVCTMPFF